MSGSTRSPRSGHRPERPKRHHVVAVVVPEMTPLEISVASEIFGIDRPMSDQPWYRFTVCTPEPGTVRLDGGLSLQVEHGLDVLRRADTVLIPGWCGRGVEPPVELLDALRAADARGTRLVS